MHGIALPLLPPFYFSETEVLPASYRHCIFYVHETSTSIEEAKMNRRLRMKNRRGNALILCLVFSGMLSLSCLIGGSYASLFIVRQALQCAADRIALFAACKLNDNNLVGQMNRMVFRNRQLVYTSNKNLEKVQQEFPQIQQLAEQLLEYDKASSNQLKNFHADLVASSELNATALMNQLFQQQRGIYKINLPWMKLSTPTMIRKFGFIKGVQSSVYFSDTLDELVQHDRNQFVDTASNLYKANVDAQLPELNELSFPIDSLPASVDHFNSPGRVALANAFDSTTQGDGKPHLKSAVQVELSSVISTGLASNAGAVIKVVGTAAAPGDVEDEEEQ